MITAVDTNVLLDLLIPSAPDGSTSKAALDDSHSRGSLIVSEVVYAELASQFEGADDIDAFLEATAIRLVHSSPAALRRASTAWLTHLRARPSVGVTCPQCGRHQVIACKSCGRPVGVRAHILSDFLVGGHAVVHADRLLSRDRGFHRAGFEDLVVVP